MKEKILILGGTGAIGTALRAACSTSSKEYLATTRNPHGVREQFIYWDIEGGHFDFPEDCRTVVYCAGLTSLEACRSDPAKSRRINIDLSTAVLTELAQQQRRIVYLSSSLVFDGKTVLPCLSTPTNPQTEYGAQKAIMEKFCLSELPHVLVVRLTKIVSSKTPIIATWLRKISERLPVEAVSDLAVSPMSAEFCARAILTLIDAEAKGLAHLSGDRDLSYFQFAQLLCKALKVDPALVRARTTEELGLLLESKPTHTTLDMSEVNRRWGLQPESVSDVVRTIASESLGIALQ